MGQLCSCVGRRKPPNKGAETEPFLEAAMQEPAAEQRPNVLVLVKGDDEFVSDRRGALSFILFGVAADCRHFLRILGSRNQF